MRIAVVFRWMMCLAFAIPAGCGGHDDAEVSSPAGNPFALDSNPQPAHADRSERRSSRQVPADSSNGGSASSVDAPQAAAGDRTPAASAQTAARGGPDSAGEGSHNPQHVVTVVDDANPDREQAADAAEEQNPLIGQASPDVHLERVDGTRFRLSEHRRQSVVVLDFWTSWCQPCVAALREMSQVASDFRDVGVIFCSINVEEDAAHVRDFLRQRRLGVSAALDRDGRVADAFSVEQFPTLVIIDKSGVIRRIHTGEMQSLRAVLKDDIGALLEGKDPVSTTLGSRLERESAAEPLLTDQPDGVDSPGIIVHESANYVLTLNSGRSIDVGSIFRSEEKQFQRRMANVMRDGKPVRINYETGSPSVFVGRTRARLHGPTVAYYEDGSTMAFLNYRHGKRDGTSFTWDTEHRPVVLEQFSEGKRDGIRCLFKACSSECQYGHIWFLEEWESGKLAAAYLVGDDGTPITLDSSAINEMQARQSEGDESESTSDELMDQSNELDAALAEISEYERTVERGEQQLSQSILQYHQNELRSAQASRARETGQLAGSRMISLRSRSLRVRTCFT